MARIRTIKPEFFRHEELYEAEQKSGLPLRLAFAGLWTCCDRDGRFRWRPRQLKLDCLPFDECDFSAILDALAEHGFLLKYSVDGVLYGCVPSFAKHQLINNREAESSIPPPRVPDACPTREARVPDGPATLLKQDQGEGKGREGEKEREREGKGTDESARAVAGDACPTAADVRKVFDHYRKHHPRSFPKPSSDSAEWRKIRQRLSEGFSLSDLCKAIDGCHVTPHNCGENDRNQTYQALELIMRTGDHVTRFMENHDRHARGSPRLSAKSARTLAAMESFIKNESEDYGPGPQETVCEFDDGAGVGLPH